MGIELTSSSNEIGVLLEWEISGNWRLLASGDGLSFLTKRNG